MAGDCCAITSLSTVPGEVTKQHSEERTIQKQAGHNRVLLVLSILSITFYGAGTTVNASANTAVEVSGLVTRISQTCAPCVPSFLAVRVIMIVVELTTCTVMTS